MNSDMKLSVIKEPDGSVLIRYRKKEDQLWKNLSIENADFEKVIDDMMEPLFEKYGKAPSEAV